MNPFTDVFKSFEEAFSCKESCGRSKDDPKMAPFAQRIVPADVGTNPGIDNRMQAGNLVFFGEESADSPMALAGTAAGSVESGRTGFSVTVGPQYRAHPGQLSDRLDINTSSSSDATHMQFVESPNQARLDSIRSRHRRAFSSREWEQPFQNGEVAPPLASRLILTSNHQQPQQQPQSRQQPQQQPGSYEVDGWHDEQHVQQYAKSGQGTAGSIDTQSSNQEHSHGGSALDYIPHTTADRARVHQVETMARQPIFTRRPIETMARQPILNTRATPEGPPSSSRQTKHGGLHIGREQVHTTYHSRLATFDKGWPHTTFNKVTPQSLAHAGFYYTPTSKHTDQVTCASSHLELAEWVDSDDPCLARSQSLKQSGYTKILRSEGGKLVIRGLVDEADVDIDDPGLETHVLVQRSSGFSRRCVIRIKGPVHTLRISDCVGLNIIAEGVAVSVLAERCSDCNLYIAGPRPPDSSFSNSNFVTLTTSASRRGVPGSRRVSVSGICDDISIATVDPAYASRAEKLQQAPKLVARLPDDAASVIDDPEETLSWHAMVAT